MAGWKSIPYSAMAKISGSERRSRLARVISPARATSTLLWSPRGGPELSMTVDVGGRKVKVQVKGMPDLPAPYADFLHYEDGHEEANAKAHEGLR